MATEQMWWQLAKRGLKYEICERKGEPRATAAPVENAQLRAATCVQLLPQARPGKQKTPLRALAKSLIFLEETGAGEGIRTLDPNLGKVVLYP
jgi:hypothetical protein